MADEMEASYEDRKALRAKLAAPILASLEQWMKDTYNTVMPKSRIGQAIEYILNLPKDRSPHLAHQEKSLIIHQSKYKFL
jgi:hypothetical protein